MTFHGILRLVLFYRNEYREKDGEIMSIMYKSTRSNSDKVTASQAILKGLADDGGLFVPDSIPALEVPLEKLADMTYQETAYEDMKLFLSDINEEE